MEHANNAANHGDTGAGPIGRAADKAAGQLSPDLQAQLDTHASREAAQLNRIREVFLMIDAQDLVVERCKNELKTARGEREKLVNRAKQLAESDQMPLAPETLKTTKEPGPLFDAPAKPKGKAKPDAAGQAALPIADPADPAQPVHPLAHYGLAGVDLEATAHPNLLTPMQDTGLANVRDVLRISGVPYLNVGESGDGVFRLKRIYEADSPAAKNLGDFNKNPGLGADAYLGGTVQHDKQIYRIGPRGLDRLVKPDAPADPAPTRRFSITEKGLTYQELAEAAGANASSLQQTKVGKAPITPVVVGSRPFAPVDQVTQDGLATFTLVALYQPTDWRGPVRDNGEQPANLTDFYAGLLVQVGKGAMVCGGADQDLELTGQQPATGDEAKGKKKKAAAKTAK